MEKPILLGVEGEAKELFIDRADAGLFFVPGDAASLTAQIFKLQLDPGLTRKLGENGRRFVLERFTRGKITQEFWNILTSPLLDSRPPAQLPEMI